MHGKYVERVITKNLVFSSTLASFDCGWHVRSQLAARWSTVLSLSQFPNESQRHGPAAISVRYLCVYLHNTRRDSRTGDCAACPRHVSHPSLSLPPSLPHSHHCTAVSTGPPLLSSLSRAPPLCRTYHTESRSVARSDRRNNIRVTLPLFLSPTHSLALSGRTIKTHALVWEHIK